MAIPILTIVLIVETVIFLLLGFYTSTTLTNETHNQLISKLRLPGQLLTNNQISYNAFKNTQFLSELTGEEVTESMVIKGDTIFYSYTPELEGKMAKEVLGSSGLSDLLAIPSGARESKYRITKEDGSTFFNIVTPLYQGDVSIGDVYIKVDISDFEKKSGTLTVIFYFISSLCVGLTTLIVFLFLRSRVIRPLAKMVKASQKIAEGDLTGSLDIHSHDELGDLAEAFNEMTVQLRQSYGTLEQKVKDRTKELAEKMKEIDRMNKTMVGRELKMAELKKKIKSLEGETEQPSSQEEA